MLDLPWYKNMTMPWFLQKKCYGFYKNAMVYTSQKIAMVPTWLHGDTRPKNVYKKCHVGKIQNLQKSTKWDGLIKFANRPKCQQLMPYGTLKQILQKKWHGLNQPHFKNPQKTTKKRGKIKNAMGHPYTASSIAYQNCHVISNKSAMYITSTVSDHITKNAMCHTYHSIRSRKNAMYITITLSGHKIKKCHVSSLSSTIRSDFCSKRYSRSMGFTKSSNSPSAHRGGEERG